MNSYDNKKTYFRVFMIIGASNLYTYIYIIYNNIYIICNFVVLIAFFTGFHYRWWDGNVKSENKMMMNFHFQKHGEMLIET